MKRLNLKLVIILGVSTLCLCLGLYFGHAMQVQSGASNLKTEAESLKQQGKRSEALNKYKVYLKQNDSDTATWVAAAKLAVEISDNAAATTTDRAAFDALIRQAYEVMTNAIRHNTDNPELRQQFAEFLMKQNVFPEALDHLEWLRDRGKHELKIDLMLATCYVYRVFPEKAVDIYAHMIGYNSKKETFDLKAGAPNEIEPYIRMAWLMREKLDVKKPKQADAVMAQLVAVNKGSFAAHLARARYLQDYSQKDPAREDIANSELDEAVKLAPEEADVIVAAAAHARSPKVKDYEKCEKLVRHGLDLFPKNVAMYQQWAMLKADQGKMAKASEQIEQGLKLLPRDPNLMLIMADIQMQQGDLKSATRTIKDLSTVPTVEKRLLDLFKARILFAEKQWLPASKEFERLHSELVVRSPEHALQALMLAAQCFQQLGEFDKQLDACKLVLDAKPDDLQAQLGVASALMSTGKTEEAQKLYEGIFKTMKADALKYPHVWLPVFQFKIADEMKKPAKDRDWSWLESLIRYMEKNETNSPESIALIKSEIQYHKGDLDAAYKTLKEAVERFPADAALRSGLATIVLEKEKEKGIDAAFKVLDEAPKSIRGNVALRLNRAGLIVRRGGENVKASLAELDAGSDKLPAADRSRLWAGLGIALNSIQDYEGAVRYWLKVADADPDDMKIRLSLFEVGRMNSDDVVMSRVLTDMRRIMGKESDDAKFVEAARTIALVRKSVQDHTSPGREPTLEPEDKQRLDSALKILAKVSRARPDWYQVARVLAEAELLDNNIAGAIEHYKKALKVGPPDSTTVRAAVMLLMKSGRTAEAESIIDLVGGPDKMKDYHLGNIVPEVLAAKGQYGEAVAGADKEVPIDSADTYGHLWVGRLHAKAGDMASAEKRFRRAVETGPDLPETWLTLVEHLVTHNKKEEAATVLMRARKQLPEDRVNLVLGPGYEVIGENVLAEQYYRAAVDANPNEMPSHKLLALFLIRKNRGEEARKEIMTVLHAAQDKPKAKADLLWARRTLAEILAATGDNEDFKKAKALLVANVKLNDVDSEDRLKLANLLAMRIDEPASLREAQGYFDSVKTLNPQEKMALANIHDVLGNWTQARNEMFELVSQASAADASLYRTYIEMLLRHDQVPQAASYLDKLAAAQKGESLLRARVYIKQGRPDDAIKLVSQMLPPRPVPKDQVWRLQTAAIEMDRLGLNSKAEELYRDYMSYVPGNGALQLAAFLGRNGRIDEALDLCETALTTEPPRSVLQAVAEVLHGQPRRIEPRHLQRVSKWYDRLLADNPGSTSLMLQHADFLILASEDDQAERLFRDLLNHSDLNSSERAIAQNDLAFVLADQHKNLDEALRLVNEAGEMMGFKSDLLDTRGTVYLAMGRYPDAVNDFNEAVTVTNPTPLKFLHLAFARDLAKDKDGARIALKSAKDARLDSAALNKSEQKMYEQLIKDVGP